MDAPRLYPIHAFKRLGHRCEVCQTVVVRGDRTKPAPIIYLRADGTTFCSRLCAALHTLNTEPLVVAQ